MSNTTYTSSTHSADKFLNNEISLSETHDSKLVFMANGFKKEGKYFAFSSKILIILFFISSYVSLSNFYDLPTVTTLLISDNEIFFTTYNVVILFLSIFISIKVVGNGLRNLFTPNTNTIATISAFSTLAFLCLNTGAEAIDILPLTPFNILLLYFCNVSFKYIKHSQVLSMKTCRMANYTGYVSTNPNVSNGSIFKKSGETDAFEINSDYIKHNNFSLFLSLLSYIFAGFLAFALSFDNISQLVWNLSAILCVMCPVGFIFAWSIPFKNISKKLLNSGAVIKSYSDVKKINKSKTILLSDDDLFPDNTIFLSELKAYGIYSDEQLLSFISSGYSGLNLGASQAFDRELNRLNIGSQPFDSLQFISESGFTFLSAGNSVSIGNSDYIISLGHSNLFGRNFVNPIYIVINNAVSGVFSLKYNATPKIYDAIANIEQEKMKINLCSIDFSITKQLLANVFDISPKTAVFDTIEERYDSIKDCSQNPNYILITRYSGASLISSVLTCKKLVLAVKINRFFGFANYILGVLMVSYLLFSGSPTLISPHTLSLFAICWSIPTFLVSFLITTK